MEAAAAVVSGRSSSWEEEWNDEVALQLSRDDTHSLDGVLPEDGIEWEEWGELPGQPSSVGTPSSPTRLSRCASGAEASVSSWAGLLNDVLELSATSKESVGSTTWLGRSQSINAPMKSTSPQVTLREAPSREGAGDGWTPRGVSARCRSREWVELTAQVEEWARRLEELREYMTSNEVELVSLVKQRTTQWLEGDSVAASAESCLTKSRYLRRMLGVVEARERQYLSRSSAAEALSDTISTLRALCGVPEDRPDSGRASSACARKPENVRYMSLETNVAAAWLRDQVSSQLKQPKYADPVIMTEEILASERKLRDACVDVFGKEVLQGLRQVGSNRQSWGTR